MPIPDNEPNMATIVHNYRALKTIARLRKLILRTETKSVLLKKTCNTILDAGYRMVWIGFVQRNEKIFRVEPVASAGFVNGYLDSINIDLNDPVYSAGPTGQSILSGKSVVMRDIHNAREFEPWRARAVELGFSSSIALPIYLTGNVVGSVNIYSREKESFDEDECTLLETLVEDLSQGIEYLRIRELYQETEKEREVMQDHMLRIQKMETIGTMAGGIAHDFNNLLNIILGFTQILLMDGTPFDDKLNEINAAARKAAAMTKQLLLIGRNSVDEYQYVNVNTLLRKNVEMVKQISGARISYRLDLAENPGYVMGNEGQMDQVILNILLNALDVLPGNGEIYVQSRPYAMGRDSLIPNARPGNYVQFSIDDTGPGMSPDVMKKVFDPFFTTKQAGKGTGLGLAVVQSIVTTHRGWINVYSEEGKGTSFKVYLPMVDEKQEDSRAVTAAIVSVAQDWHVRQRILFIEDDPSIRSMVGNFLEGKGFHVHRAKDAREALKIVDKMKESITLIFSDIVLPDEDGLTLAEKIRARGLNVKFIFASGYADARSRASEIEQRGDLFFQKPYDLQQILDGIYALVG